MSTSGSITPWLCRRWSKIPLRPYQSMAHSPLRREESRRLVGLSPSESRYGLQLHLHVFGVRAVRCQTTNATSSRKSVGMAKKQGMESSRSGPLCIATLDIPRLSIGSVVYESDGDISPLELDAEASAGDTKKHAPKLPLYPKPFLEAWIYDLD